MAKSSLVGTATPDRILAGFTSTAPSTARLWDDQIRCMIPTVNWACLRRLFPTVKTLLLSTHEKLVKTRPGALKNPDANALAPRTWDRVLRRSSPFACRHRRRAVLDMAGADACGKSGAPVLEVPSAHGASRAVTDSASLLSATDKRLSPRRRGT